MKTPEYIMQKLRKRRGLEPEDKTQDDLLRQMTPENKLREVCGWELGDKSWAGQFVSWARDCGYTIEP